MILWWRRRVFVRACAKLQMAMEKMNKAKTKYEQEVVKYGKR